MYKALEVEVCDECESIDGLIAKPSPTEDTIQYNCRDCRAEWIEYV